MNAKALIVAATFGVVGCGEPTFEPYELVGLDLGAAKSDARKFLGEEFDLIAICGGSKGVGFYSDEATKGFQEDEISDGVIAFGHSADGRLNIVHRDALKSMTSVSDYADAQVTRDVAPSGLPQGVWTVRFSESGIVETHNLTSDPEGNAFDLWTSNKSSDLIGGRASAFVARCEFL